MENLSSSLLELINGIGQDRSVDILSNSFGNLQFRINYDEINHRLQDYIDLDIPEVDGVIRENKNVIITSETQVGKTGYIIENCKKNINRPYLFVLTCDNSNAQMNQLKTRLGDNGIVAFDIKKAGVNKVENILRDGKAVFILMLNNESQITKLETLVNKIRVSHRPSQYVIFHDEADTVNKADIGVDIDDVEVPISHRKWLSFFETLSCRNEMVKRFWVTATPENCSSLSKITGRDIVVLPVPVNYIAVSEQIDWDGIRLAPMGVEIERIRSADNGEVILYCVDKKKQAQSTIAIDISLRFNCTAVCYNGDGASVYINGQFSDEFDDEISDVLNKLRESGPIVVVGYNLMNRGISFVASPNSRNGYSRIAPPPTATVMFYSGGSGSHMVGLAQRFGRICGTSRPDLTRRVVYCSSDVYSDYKAYLANQRIVFSKLANGGEDMTMAEILAGSGGGMKVGRSLDRPALKSVNVEYSDSCSSSDSGSVDWDEDKMHRLVDSWKFEGNNTAIARLFRRMIAGGGKLESGLVREYFSTVGPYNATTNTNTSARYNLVFRKDKRYHYIRNEVLEYLE